MKLNFKRPFFTGLVIILPVLISIWVVRFLFSQIDGAVTPVVLHLIRLAGLGKFIEHAWVEYVAPTVSVASALFLIFLIGLFGGNVIGRQVLKFLERLVMQIPLVRGIYSATRQFLESFSGDREAFRKVVLCEYPRKGIWSMGLLTNVTRGEVQERTEKELVSVFIPTTPNPTSGWLLFIPREDCIVLDMDVDDAFKMIVSGGVLVPSYSPVTPGGEQPRENLSP